MRTDSAIVPRLMKSCSREITGISDCLYYALVLDEGYPDLARSFEDAAMVEMEIFKLVGNLLLSLGRDPYVERSPVRAGVGRLGKNSVEGILRNICNRMTLEIDEYERILSSWGEGSGRDLMFEIIDKKKMLFDSFERVLNS